MRLYDDCFKSEIIYFTIFFSLNPAVDIGQVEGAFIMGLGYSLTEEVVYDPATGKMITNDTWVGLGLGSTSYKKKQQQNN